MKELELIEKAIEIASRKGAYSHRECAEITTAIDIIASKLKNAEEQKEVKAVK